VGPSAHLDPVEKYVLNGSDRLTLAEILRNKLRTDEFHYVQKMSSVDKEIYSEE
jgi:hypothetical protein